MTLSNKSWKVVSDPINPNYDLDVIKTSDIKDFIRTIIERIGDHRAMKIIEEESGDKLI